MYQHFYFYHSQQATYIIRSWLTLHNCEIYYLSADKYDPLTTDAIFIRVNIYPGPGVGGLMLNSYTIYLIMVTIYPAALLYNINRGHYFPARITALFWLLSRL